MSRFKRLIAILVAAVMVLSLVPSSAGAASMMAFQSDVVVDAVDDLAEDQPVVDDSVEPVVDDVVEPVVDDVVVNSDSVDPPAVVEEPVVEDQPVVDDSVEAVIDDVVEPVVDDEVVNDPVVPPVVVEEPVVDDAVNEPAAEMQPQVVPASISPEVGAAGGDLPEVPKPQVVVITGNSLACDGTFVVTITGQAEEGTRMNVGWRDLDDGRVINAYNIAFPGEGTFTYTPAAGSVLATNMIANAFIGDIATGGPNGFARAWECNTTPEEPEPPADVTINAKALTDHSCDATEWHFVINQVDDASNAPASIQVTWADGSSETVLLNKVTGGVAHYATTSNLDSTVTSASAVIYAEWVNGNGQFNLSHGPCAVEEPEPELEVALSGFNFACLDNTLSFAYSANGEFYLSVYGLGDDGGAKIPLATNELITGESGTFTKSVDQEYSSYSIFATAEPDGEAIFSHVFTPDACEEPEPTIVIVGNSLVCSGAFEVTITVTGGEVAEGTRMNVGWRDLDDGRVINAYNIAFPGEGTFTYTPAAGSVLATNMIANAFIGDIATGGPNGFAKATGCGEEPPVGCVTAKLQESWSPDLDLAMQGQSFSTTITVTGGEPGSTVQYSLSSYKINGPTFDPTFTQHEFSGDTVVLTFNDDCVASGTLEITIPACYFQVDLYRGPQLATVGPPEFHGKKLLDYKVGGDTLCDVKPEPSETPVTPEPSPSATPVTPEPSVTPVTPTPSETPVTPSTPVPTPDKQTPTPDVSTPSPSPDAPKPKPTEETKVVPPVSDDEAPPSDTVVTGMPVTGSGDAWQQSSLITPMWLLVAAAVLTFTSASIKWSKPVMATIKKNRR